MLKSAFYFCLLPDIVDFRNEFIRMLYNHCAKFVYGVAIFINFSQVVKLYQIFNDDPFILDEVFRNLNITLYFTNVIIRGIFLKGKLSGKIFKKVFEFEDSIYSTGDPTVQATYQTSLSLVQTTKYCYVITAFLMMGCYLPAPLFRDPYYITINNETVAVPQMPVSIWIPFHKSYLLSYLYAASCGSWVTYIFTITDMICYCFILFGVCQMDVLCHYISNFERYATEHSATHGTTLEKSLRKMQKDNLQRHKEIISYVIQLNDTMKNILLADFVPSSIQMATIIYLMLKNLSVVQVFLLSQFIVFQLARIFIYCYSANILTQKGLEIGTYWYNLDWTEYPEDIRKNIVMCILRPQKPLHISIGKFHDISLETFLAIVRGTYSYSLLLTTI
ncbi:unnamed protein product [Ceutorhynchus assimilis]|uniref:Odorant receptor n=1 Tax=Ceutorhynchus assimilis TaxID=467358 RepID=A0A9N9MNJ4_9CUCU|nr:unnamed protein product [Ceutorhynchus assimilis]